MVLTRGGGALAFPTMSQLSWFPFLDPVIRLENYRADGRFVVRAELPGIDPAKDVSITARDGVLHLGAVRLKETHDGAHSEFRYGTFYRTVKLPPGAEEDTISASYANGILEITISVGDAVRAARAAATKALAQEVNSDDQHT